MMRKVNVFFCLFLLCFQLMPISLVFAETVENTPTSETTTSSLTKDPLKSTEASEEQKPTPAPESEQPVLNYEDQQLLEQEQKDTSLPAVLLEEKAMNQEVVLRGRVTAGSEGQGTNHSETKMHSLILQRAKDETDWEDHHVFPVEESKANVSKDSYGIDFSESLEEPGNYRYRLIMDYSVASFEEERLVKTAEKKASLEVGSVEVLEEKTSETEQPESIVEESVESEEPTEPTKSTEPEISASTSESSSVKETTEESKEVNQDEEKEPIAPPPMETTSLAIPTKASTSELPEMQDNYRQAFQRGLGIMPLAANNPGVTGEIRTWGGGSNGVSERLRFEKIQVYSSKYLTKTTVAVTFRVTHTYMTSGITDRIFTLNITDHYGASGGVVENKATFRAGNTYKTATGVTQLDRQAGGSLDVQITDVSSSLTKGLVEASSNSIYTRAVLQFTLNKVPINKEMFYLKFGDSQFDGKNTINYGILLSKIAQAPFGDLTAISTPNFTGIDGNTGEVDMEAGTYTGDISHTTNDGIFNLSTTDGTSWTEYIPNLVHTNSTNGTYAKRRISGLAAGRKYLGKVTLLDAFGNKKDSPTKYFCSPNSVNKPTVSELSVPTTANNAKASLVGSYNVHAANPAHPAEKAANVRVQISTNGSSWTNVTASNVSIVQNTKKVNYTIANLKANTKYYSRYAVKNDSGAWSPWSSVDITKDFFTTKGLALKISPPNFTVFDESDLVDMEEGTYTGDVSSALGTLQISVDNGNNFSNYLPNALVHTTTTNGTYEKRQITGLAPGGKYQGKVLLYDSSGDLARSDSTEFITPNAVNKPSVTNLGTPTSKSNATATLVGTYKVGTNPAHPADSTENVRVQISTDGNSWTNVSASGVSIAHSNKEVTYTISGLNADTTYFTRFAVKNESTKWSPWSESRDFTTASLPPGLYITDAPSLDFGMVNKQVNNQTATLSADSVKDHVVVDNSDVSLGWTLTAKLEPLKRISDAKLLPWATLRMDITLQDTADGGVTWNDYTTGVTGAPRTITLKTGEAAQTLWGINNPANAQGTFRNQIDWSSVELDVPGGNHEGLYQGKLTWSLNSVP